MLEIYHSRWPQSKLILLPVYPATFDRHLTIDTWTYHLMNMLSQRFCSLAALLTVLQIVLATSGGLSASEYLATDDFASIEPIVAGYVEQFGAEHVLLVVDVDNTLLAMDNELGSDQWFEWQDFLLANEPNSPHLVAKSFSELLDAQGLLYVLGRMHPPQKTQPAMIARLQGSGIATLVLTSRGHEFRLDTERELVNSGYDFERTALQLKEPRGGTYLPYDPKDFQAAGFSDAEAKKFELAKPRPVSYERGIMMVAGQHKGAMMLTMLQQAKRDIRAVVFVDDHGRHVGRVFSAATGRGIEVTTVHYFHEDDRVDAFRYSDKRDVSRQWNQLNRVLDGIFEAEAVH